MTPPVTTTATTTSTTTSPDFALLELRVTYLASGMLASGALLRRQAEHAVGCRPDELLLDEVVEAAFELLDSGEVTLGYALDHAFEVTCRAAERLGLRA